MQDKYKKFKEYDWQHSEAWQSYYRNLFPIPPGDKIEKYKRKFYKLKIDPDFDIHYNEPSSHNNTTSSSSFNSHSTSSNQSNTHSSSSASTSSNQFIYPILKLIEIFLLIIFIFSLLTTTPNLYPILISSLIDIFINCGPPSFTAEYLSLLFQTESLCTFLPSLIMAFTSYTNIFLLIPLCISSILTIHSILLPYSTTISTYIPLLTHIFTFLSSTKPTLQLISIYIEIFNAFILNILNFFISKTPLMFVVMYLQQMKIKHIINPQTQTAFNNINAYLTAIKSNQQTPQFMLMCITAIQKLFTFLNNINM